MSGAADPDTGNVLVRALFRLMIWGIVWFAWFVVGWNHGQPI